VGKQARSISLRVRITPKLLRELQRLAEQNRRTVSNYGFCAARGTRRARRATADQAVILPRNPYI